jgi:hypothetical protein
MEASNDLEFAKKLEEIIELMEEPWKHSWNSRKKNHFVWY